MNVVSQKVAINWLHIAKFSTISEVWGSTIFVNSRVLNTFNVTDMETSSICIYSGTIVEF